MLRKILQVVLPLTSTFDPGVALAPVEYELEDVLPIYDEESELIFIVDTEDGHILATVSRDGWVEVGFTATRDQACMGIRRCGLKKLVTRSERICWELINLGISRWPNGPIELEEEE